MNFIRRRLSEHSKMTASEILIVTENDELLEDDYMLEDYEIKNEEPDDIVSLIKRRLSELTVPRMTESEFFLIREENTILHDDYTLEDYEIENEEVLRIEVRGGRGGTTF